MQVHEDWAACKGALAALGVTRWFAIETCGHHAPHEIALQAGDAFVFGSETRGLASAVLADFAPDRQLRLPMRPSNRSLNLSNAVAVTVYEAWRQLQFAGSA
jgi:tRNA (cytidine/uridine-2'-O-)-methyltransferase